MTFTLRELGANIKRIRKSRSSRIRPDRPLLQKELAERSGVPAPSLSNIENGKYQNPTWNVLMKIAQGLECEITEFFLPDHSDISPSRIAFEEVIEMIVKEKLEKLLEQEGKTG